jgi:FtsP/CotA-like multicopper oxidase with cupredoxin domain
MEASEFTWELKPGKTIRAWGFKVQVPGPVLKAKQGDTLVVKVINKLPEATMVHWHGIRLPASMDGTGEVQQPIEPGESFEYRFEVPDAGTFLVSLASKRDRANGKRLIWRHCSRCGK